MNTTTHLQGIGTVNAKPAGELQPGDVTVWNYGYQYAVLGVERLSPKFVRLALVKPGDDSGEVWYRRTAINFAVAVVDAERARIARERAAAVARRIAGAAQ